MTARDDVIGLSTYTWERLWAGLEGLTDDEYRWQPVAGAWTVRDAADGRPLLDHNLWPGPRPPFTAMPWRLAHLVDVYGNARNSQWLRVSPPSPPVNREFWHRALDASGALELLDAAARHWHEVLDAVSEASLQEPLGEQAGPYAESSLMSFVLHQLDEAIHHGAEVGVLRDLYRWRPDGDQAAGEATFESLQDDARAVDRAADLGRWDLVEQLVAAGAPVGSEGRTALHQAAAIGEMDLVRLLVEHGAALDAVDPDWQSTPLGWAEFFGRREVADFLRSRPG